MKPVIEDDPLVDEFGRTLEEQLQDQVIHEYWIHRDQYQGGEYNSETSHLDGEILPHGVQIIYDYGPQYSVETYLPKWHHDKAVELLDESYEALLNYFATNCSDVGSVPDGGHQIDNPTQDQV